MQDESDHAAVVRAWMERETTDLPAERLVDAFDAGFRALWRRANRTLGDVTLAAIMDRVLLTAMERFPTLAALEIEATGIRSGSLRERARSLRRDQLAEGLCFVLVEFLTVLGNLTAEILTPALHGELSRVASSSEESKP
jgi:hypothetical protein